MRELKIQKSGKLLIALMAVTILMATMMVLSVSAALSITEPADVALGGTASVAVSGASGTEQVTLLVYLGTPDDANILYIDQKAAEAGEATFSFPVPDTKDEGEYTVLVGSESSATAANSILKVGEGGGEVGDKVPTSIAINPASLPTASYYVGDSINLTVGGIIVTYDDSSTANLALNASGVTVTGFDSSVAAIGQVITVSYTDGVIATPLTATYTVDIVAAPVDEIVSLTATGYVTSYYVNDLFNYAVGNLVATYSISGAKNVDFDEAGVVVTYDFTSAGTKTVTVTYDGEVATFDVTVSEPPMPGDNVTGITMTTTAPVIYGIGAGKTAQLDAAVVPANAANKTVKYVSLNPAVATVDATGLVTGVALGTVKVVAVTADGGFVAVANVTVNNADTVATAGIRIKIVKMDGTTPVPGASVRIYRTGAPATDLTVITDSQGYATFDGITPVANGALPANKFTVVVSAADYTTRTIANTASFAITNAAPVPANIGSGIGTGNILKIADKNQYDVNGDGIVNAGDLLAVSNNQAVAPSFGTN